MEIQWWIDTFGKLGPLAVATAVYMTNRKQNRWAQIVATRAAQSDDQKLRLALLDRRLIVLDALETAIAEYEAHNQMSQEIIDRVKGAYKAAELVYDGRLVGEIKMLGGDLMLWTMQNRWRTHSDLDPEQAALIRRNEHQIYMGLTVQRSRLHHTSNISEPLALEQQAPFQLREWFRRVRRIRFGRSPHVR